MKSVCALANFVKNARERIEDLFLFLPELYNKFFLFALFNIS